MPEDPRGTDERAWSLHEGLVEEIYKDWPTPDLIISDGAYGIRGFPGDPPTPQELPAWYAPHIEAWTAAATADTTLCVWNTEIGWVTLHPELTARGWLYETNIHWSKGMAHVAGRVNEATLGHLPVVTETCGVYRRPGADTETPVNGPEGLEEWRLTNMWDHPAVRGPERLHNARGKIHPNQKPLTLMRRLVKLFSRTGGTIWEPFGGLCTASAAALAEGRTAHAAEPDSGWAACARARLNQRPEPEQQTLLDSTLFTGDETPTVGPGPTTARPGGARLNRET